MGAGFLIEVTGFSFMALFIARLGTTPVAGHQIAMNLISLMFMLPMSVGNATSTLVAQRIGAQALGDARRLGWHGLWLGPAWPPWSAAASTWPAPRCWSSTPAMRRGGRHPAAAGLAGRLPRGRRGADGGGLHAAGLAHRHGTDGGLRGVAVGCGAGGGYLLAFNVTGAVPPRCRAPRASGPPPRWACWPPAPG
jgi:MATE family multidrug resistance protein